MAKIYNSDVTKGLAKNAGIQQSREKTPDELAEKIVPTFETNPEKLRKANYTAAGSITSTTGGTLITLDSNKDFYLTNATLSYVKDATSTMVEMSLRVIVDGATVRILQLGGITLTAGSLAISKDLSFPLKIDRGSHISLSSNSNVGVHRMDWSITGYYVDNPNI